MMYLMALVALAVFNTLALAASSTQGYAISFDNSKFITIPNSSSLNPSRFTLECWVRFLDVEDNGSTFFIISKGFQKAPGAYSIWYYGGDKKLAFGVSDAQDNYYFFFADHAPLVSNRWYHVAGTYDGNALKLYLNSELIGEKDVGSITLGNKNPLQFGDLFEGYVSTRHGIIDEVRIWSVARTPEEISEIMYQEIDTAPGLISAWHFNEGSGQSVSDATGGNNGYLGSASSEDNNDPQWVQSDAPAPDSPFLQVFSPNGGEEWQMGMVQTIRWTAWKIATIHIEYSPDGGISWRTVADTIDAASGSYTWIAPEAVTSDGLIRITDSSNSGYTDVSDSAFSVLNPYIRLLSPIGGEKWETGTIQNITWNSLGVEKVIPDYSTDNGSTWTPISGEMVASADTLAWKIPYTSSETCRVRIRTPDSSVLSINESPFSIFKSGITLENQEGEILQPKAEGWVYWEATQGVDSVRVEYSADDGATWRLLGITFRIPPRFSWTIPEEETSRGLIRVSWAAHPEVGDTVAVSVRDQKVYHLRLLGAERPGALVVSEKGDSLYDGNTFTSWDFPGGLSISSSDILQYFTSLDNSAYLWTKSNDTYFYNNTSWEKFTYPGEGLKSNSVRRAIHASDGTIWADNSYAAGEPPITHICIAHLVDNSWTTYELMTGTWENEWQVASVVAGPDGGAWVVVAGNSGTIHYRNWKGMLFQFVAGSWTQVATVSGRLTSVAAGPDNSIWLGTLPFTDYDGYTRGGCLSHYMEGTVTTYSKDNGLLDNSVSAVAVGPNGAVWVQTETGISNFGRTGVKSTEAAPMELAIRGNYPNPFNPATTISFAIPVSGRASLMVYDVTGRKVRELVSGSLPAGKSTAVWDGKDDSGKPVSSGVYFARLTMGKHEAVGKMLLMK